MLWREDNSEQHSYNEMISHIYPVCICVKWGLSISLSDLTTSNLKKNRDDICIIIIIIIIIIITHFKHTCF